MRDYWKEFDDQDPMKQQDEFEKMQGHTKYQFKLSINRDSIKKFKKWWRKIFKRG